MILLKAHHHVTVPHHHSDIHLMVMHVITGDFDIIQKEGLKRLLLKGPNYREQASISWGYNM